MLQNKKLGGAISICSTEHDTLVTKHRTEERWKELRVGSIVWQSCKTHENSN